MNSIDCGERHPCQTLGFLLNHLVTNDCIIRIDNDKAPKLFIIYQSFPLMQNLTMFGVNGQPTISFKGNTVKSRHFFKENELNRTKIVTLRIENIIFKGIGIVHLIMEGSDNVSFINCHFEKTVTGMDIIHIESRPDSLHRLSKFS